MCEATIKQPEPGSLCFDTQQQTMSDKASKCLTVKLLFVISFHVIVWSLNADFFKPFFFNTLLQ